MGGLHLTAYLNTNFTWISSCSLQCDFLISRQNLLHHFWSNITNAHTCNNFILIVCVVCNVITPYIRMLDSDWLIAVIFFTNSGLALWIFRIFTLCTGRCICIRFNFCSWFCKIAFAVFTLQDACNKIR